MTLPELQELVLKQFLLTFGGGLTIQGKLERIVELRVEGPCPDAFLVHFLLLDNLLRRLVSKRAFHATARTNPVIHKKAGVLKQQKRVDFYDLWLRHAREIKEGHCAEQLPEPLFEVFVDLLDLVDWVFGKESLGELLDAPGGEIDVTEAHLVGYAQVLELV